MRTSNVLAGVACALWAAMLWIGFELVDGIAHQHVPGFPNSGQIFHDIWIPIIMMAGLMLSVIVFNIGRSARPLKYVSVGAIIFLLFHFITSGGGV
jgi:hypothetical protein